MSSLRDWGVGVSRTMGWHPWLQDVTASQLTAGNRSVFNARLSGVHRGPLGTRFNKTRPQHNQTATQPVRNTIRPQHNQTATQPVRNTASSHRNLSAIRQVRTENSSQHSQSVVKSILKKPIHIGP